MGTDAYIAAISMFGGNFAPRNWAFCNGQLQAIAQNSALFSLIGTIYGGDGRTTFALPDLRSRVAIHSGTGPGLSTYRLGLAGGTENVTLNTLQIPSHNHTAVMNTGGDNPLVDSSTNNVLAHEARGGQDLVEIYTSSANANQMRADAITVGQAGGNQSHTNIQPYLAVNYCICLFGVFPPRN